jgi:hypothetical protein
MLARGRWGTLETFVLELSLDRRQSIARGVADDTAHQRGELGRLFE